MKKKVLSVFLAAVMCLSTLGVMAVPASAANTSSLFTVSFKGKEINSATKSFVNKINAVRTASGLNGVTADANLTKVAHIRAKELIINHNYTLPSGGNISKYIPDFNPQEYAYIYGATRSALSGDDLYDIIEEYFDIYSINLTSIGVGVFAYDSSHYTYFILLSTKEPTSKQSSYTDKSVTAKVLTKPFYLNLEFSFTELSRARRKISLIANPNGIVPRINLTKQFTYTSSDKSIAKVKDYIVYGKKNGTVKITAKSKSNSKYTVKHSVTFEEFNNVKVKGLKVTSPKKKEIKATWKYFIKGIHGYQIQYSTNSKFKKGNKTVTVKGAKTLKKTIKKLKSKKTYYVRIRAYVDQGNGERCYTAWSGKVKVKVK